MADSKIVIELSLNEAEILTYAIRSSNPPIESSRQMALWALYTKIQCKIEEFNMKYDKT